MGITIVQKGDLTKTRLKAPKALILAGGAITGGSFMAGGVKALNDYFVGSSVNDFNIFVGISSGSLIASALMGGISPESIVKSLDGTSSHFAPLTAWHCYRPNISELLGRPIDFLIQAASWLPSRISTIVERYPTWSRGVLGSAWRFILSPDYAAYEEMMRPFVKAATGGDFPSLLTLLPSGIFDNTPIENYVRNNIEENALVNDFRKAARITGKKLYITAVSLDGAKRVVFGPDEDHHLTISQAIQASTALPGFYKPAHINGVDYVDGGVKDTADINIAVKKGAKLIICYNPFRPYEPDEFIAGFKKSRAKGLAAGGIMAVINQIFRAFLHERLSLVLEGFKRSPEFDGDIILIEPSRDDSAFFALNPLALGNRVKASQLGFESAHNSIEMRFDEIKRIMASYGVKMTKRTVEEKIVKMSKPNVSESEVRRLLEGRSTGKRKRLSNVKR